MNKKDLMHLAKLRLCVGFLGEAHQKSWWPSNFFSPNSTAFLSPVFAKTPILSGYYGIKEAATRVHDEHIGIGKGVYHLFRLPEMIEIELHELLNQQISPEEIGMAKSPGTAAEFLSQSAHEIEIADSGPVWMGETALINNKTAWQKAAYLYFKAFSDGTRVFPYFSGNK